MTKIVFLVSFILGATLFADNIKETTIKLPAFPRYESKFLTQVNIEIPPSRVKDLIEAAAMVSAVSAIIISDDSGDKRKKKIMRDEKEKPSFDSLFRPRTQASYETR